jgi:hypothetical protein
VVDVLGRAEIRISFQLDSPLRGSRLKSHPIFLAQIAAFYQTHCNQ